MLELYCKIESGGEFAIKLMGVYRVRCGEKGWWRGEGDGFGLID